MNGINKNIRRKKQILHFALSFCILIFAFYIIAPQAQAVDWLPLVPCGLNSDPAGAAPGTYTHECTTCDLLHLLRNIIFAIEFGVVPIGGSILFTVAGIFYILGGANPGNISKAKSIFTNTIYAIIVISIAWLITNTVLVNLGDKIQYKVPGKWYEFQCSAVPPLSGPQPTGPAPTGVVPGQAQAKALIASGVIFSQNGDCGSAYTAQTTIQAIAAGNYPPVCSVSCACSPGGTSGTTTVNPAILDGLLSLKQNIGNFTVTSFTTGVHSGGSSHYTGHAADIVPATSDRSAWQRYRSYLNGLGGKAICEDKKTLADVPDCNANQVDHIHWTN